MPQRVILLGSSAHEILLYLFFPLQHRYEWFHPDFPEKTYLFSNTTGSVFTVDIETRLGLIKMYSLRSKTFGLGSAWCWVGDDYDRGVRADGYWENGDA
jgi:hypothetical protein